MARTSTRMTTPKAVAQSTPSVRPTPPNQPSPAPRRPTLEEVRKRAYELYLSRRGVNGTPESDWLQAERELSGR
ncbi:MAG: DUF2934 domain-containing protein [Phycisphaeraceae bacterium]|nr:DUF2934 domain-containing protein [Phycisphaeraceae bacterium]